MTNTLMHTRVHIHSLIPLRKYKTRRNNIITDLQTFQIKEQNKGLYE